MDELPMLRPVPLGQLLSRGIYKLPVMGDHGEIVVVAVTSHHSMTPSSPYTIPRGTDHIAVVDWLWLELERIDPPSAPADDHRQLKLI